MKSGRCPSTGATLRGSARSRFAVSALRVAAVIACDGCKANRVVKMATSPRANEKPDPRQKPQKTATYRIIGNPDSFQKRQKTAIPCMTSARAGSGV